MKQKEPDHRDIAENLVAALKGDRFILYAQAIKPVAGTGEKAQYQEILVRFAEEEEKLLPPGGFFPTLERLNLMVALDKWVINRVLRWLAANGAGAGIMRCSINLSTDSILASGFSDFIGHQLRTSMVPSDTLLFEISEEDADRHAFALDRLILPLKILGCGFVITGYSGRTLSIEMLQALGVNLVKIDGRIIRRIHEDNKSLAAAQSIHAACREIGAQTVAELVEQEGTVAKLKEIGIDFAQGYGIAKPMPLS